MKKKFIGFFPFFSELFGGAAPARPFFKKERKNISAVRKENGICTFRPNSEIEPQ